MLILLLAQNEAVMSDRIAQSLTLMGVGMAVVFTALMLLWLAILIMDRLTDRAVPAEQPPQPKAPVSEASPPSGQHDPQLLAVLTAAATAAMGQRVKLRRVHFVGEAHDDWTREGRRVVMTSHRPHLHRRG
jgi:sodium pump decarboxylase gamma subunit